MHQFQKLILFVFLLLFGFSCSTRNAAGKICFQRKKTIVIGFSSGKMADTYLKLKKGNYFVLYDRILGLTKTTKIKGQFTQDNDTLFLAFCDDYNPRNLSGIAVFDNANNKILLFENSGYIQHFHIRTDNRQR